MRVIELEVVGLALSFAKLAFSMRQDSHQRADLLEFDFELESRFEQSLR